MSTSDSMSFAYDQGTPVLTSEGRFGTLEDVLTESGSDIATTLRVRRETDGQIVDVPAAYIDTASSNYDQIVLSKDYETASVQPIRDFEPPVQEEADELIIPVHEEVLVPETHETNLGKVIIRKRIEEVPVSTSVDVERDQVVVERVEINQPVDTVPGPRQEGDTLIIPVVEEVLFTEKRLMLREEIRITRQRLTEAVAVEETLRREVVEFEERHGDTIANTLDPAGDDPKPRSR
ncbi:MAG TPA: YsnF/AvaK domain-containing protein [Thermomicrobiales bacterium]|nr:YsnF/AvaK domain-containing protein [Thermomicrobiales bacterium]